MQYVDSAGDLSKQIAVGVPVARALKAGKVGATATRRREVRS
jgi:hypothetical protein